MTDLGKSLIILGCIIAAAGVLLMLSGKLPWLGRLPGDITIENKHVRFFAPITTCIVLSVVISLVLWVISLLRK